MTAAATKPRAKAAPAAHDYTRPVQTFFPEVGKTAEERLAALRATLQAADEKLKAAYYATERGTVVDTLLHLVAHDLLCTAMHPVLRNDDEGEIPVTKADLNVAYEAFFPVLAVLEGAMALSMGTVLTATLVEAFQLLDWAQSESDSCALGALLAVQPPAAPRPPKDAEAGRDAGKPVDEACGHYQHALAVVEAAVQQVAHHQERSALVYAARNLMRRDLGPFFEALTSEPDEDALNDASAALSVVVGLLEAAAFANDDSCLWGAHTLAGLSKEALDEYIEKVERSGAAS